MSPIFTEIKEGKKKIKVIKLQESDLISVFQQYEGKFLAEEDVKYLAVDDCDVYKPNGDLLMKYRKNVISKELCDMGYEGLKDAARKSLNRGIAAGYGTKEGFPETMQDRLVPMKGGRRFKYFRKSDQGFSNTNIAMPVYSGIAGYFDNTSSRFPYCRTTAFTREYLEKWEKAIPYIQRISELYKELTPDKWENQRLMVEKTHPDWIIPGTVYSTVTVNKNYRIAVHQDAGDLKEGFGNLTVFRRGSFEGANLCFPKYGVAVDLQEGDFLAMDIHEWHGGTPFKNCSEDYERISIVCYYRAEMYKCGSKEEEEAKEKAFVNRDQEQETKKNRLF